MSRSGRRSPPRATESIRRRRRFWRKYVFSVDHKVIGIQYMSYSLAMLVVGGLLAMLVRWQMAFPGRPLEFMGKIAPSGMPCGIMLPEFYNALFTMHATVMIFFAIMPLLIGAFGNYVVPLQIGARDMAFPRLNMMSFWTAVPGGIVIIASFFVEGGAAQSGWTSYAPLSAIQPRGQTLWLLVAPVHGPVLACSRPSTSSRRSSTCARRECTISGCR